MSTCECECGTLLPDTPYKGRVRRFMLGHNSRQQRKVRCIVDGCDRFAKTHGMCQMHHERLQTSGSTDVPLRSRLGDPVTQFWRKVDQSNQDGCWEWQGGRSPLGYGLIGHRNGVTPSGTHSAHRAAYELLVGPIPPETPHLDHLCRNPPCCNPTHLEPVTVKENVRRGLNGPIMKTCCPQGHPYEVANLYIRRSDGARRCRQCSREKVALYRANMRAEAHVLGFTGPGDGTP